MGTDSVSDRMLQWELMVCLTECCNGNDGVSDRMLQWELMVCLTECCNGNDGVSDSDVAMGTNGVSDRMLQWELIHFLSYLNSLRVKEYCTAVHNLYHYFDRNVNLMETNSTNKGKEEDTCRRYAALNLALLHYRFGHKKESKAALHEAIRLAQGTNDQVCLQHALVSRHL
ncbi:hypothetical protein CHS0354_028688 [Potamilus streckersoni]|uniref:Anaphase-promoting complex subunit 5 n=1 Tax=Potamilus streckersoni TaxID=2493646 RepID=A0AAE0T570_9BIVA|nr:hypothetical protein CHS0354_028688 [Potamilus streckersoni]